MIQKQIYLAALKYNLVLVHKLQKYLLNCNEAKILSIKQVLNDIYLYYINYSKEKYLFENHLKFSILKCFFNYENINRHKLLQKIKQNLFLLCIRPEWKAKIPRYKKNYFVDSISLNNFIKDKENKILPCIEYTIKRLKSFNYINKSVKQWLQNGFCFSLYDMYNLKSKIYKNKIICHSNCFYSLLIKIINIDILWSFFYLSSITKIYQFENKNNKIWGKKKFKFRIIDNNRVFNLGYIKLLINKTKTLLYKKNYLNKLKSNTSITKNNLLYKISKIVKLVNISYLTNINHQTIKFVYCLLNTILYYWLKKIYSISFYRIDKYNIKNNNYFLNFHIYSCMIKKYYDFLF